jgi:hypothetical protein
MKLRATMFVGLMILLVAPASIARGGGGGHGGGGGGGYHGGGGGYHGGGGGAWHGGYSPVTNHGSSEMGYNRGWGNGEGWGNNPDGRGYRGYGGYGYPGYGYGGVGYGYGGVGYGYGGNIYDNGYSAGGFGNAPVNGSADPLADYYRQQAQTSAMAQTQTMSSVPSGFGGVSGAMPINTSIQNPSVTAASRVDVGNEVRDNFHGSGLFAPGWWKGYKNAWCNTAWTANWVWGTVEWDTL